MGHELCVECCGSQKWTLLQDAILAEGGFDVNAWNLLPCLFVEGGWVEAGVVLVLVVGGRKGVEWTWPAGIRVKKEY